MMLQWIVLSNQIASKILPYDERGLYIKKKLKCCDVIVILEFKKLDYENTKNRIKQ